MKRYLIIGASGSGKSSMAKAVADICSIPYTDTDALYWREGWVLRNENDVVDELPLGEANWVFDGSFRSCHEQVWPHATSIIWLNLPPHIILRRITKRNLGWWFSRKPTWSGNIMPFSRAMAGIRHTSSHLKQIQMDFPEFLELYTDKDIHILSSPDECSEWLRNLKIRQAEPVVPNQIERRAVNMETI